MSTSKWGHGSPVSWASSFLPIFSLLRSSILHLVTGMEQTDRRTDTRPGWYLRQKPLGEVRQVVSPPFPFPFPSLPPFHSPKFSDKPVGGKVRSSEGKVPRLPPYKYHLHTTAINALCTTLWGRGLTKWRFGVAVVRCLDQQLQLCRVEPGSCWDSRQFRRVIRSTQPGHPFVGKRTEYQRMLGR